MMHVMRGLVLVASLVAAFAAAPAAADEASPALQARSVISRQLDAFAHDDAAGAYALAAPAMKAIFASPEVFMAMVRLHYAPVYRHRSVDFGDAQRDGDAIAITATLVDGDNEVWTALYKLARQPDGQWLINGCVLVKSSETSL